MTSLIVPIDVQALRVGRGDADKGAKLHRPLHDFSELPNGNDTGARRKAYVSDSVRAGAAPFEGTVAAPVGVHIHWALPEALLHGERTDDSGWRFPAAPNRWLVTRRWAAINSLNSSCKSWIIESDRLSVTHPEQPGLPHPTAPIDPQTGGQLFRYLGQRFRIEEWRESEAPRLSPFTGIGYGSLTFAAFYPNCSTSFGFFDAADDLTECGGDLITYHVVGWYSDPVNDPLATAERRGEFAKFWRGAEDLSLTSTVLNGGVLGLSFDPSATYLTDRDRPITGSMGSSEEEAFSALMAKWAGLPQLEDLMNGLQFGLLLDGKERIDALEKFSEAVHLAGFRSIDGGSQWAISPVQPTTDPAATLGPASKPKPAAEISPNLIEPLRKLNALQRDQDELARRLSASRKLLFADWRRYLSLLYEDESAPEELAERVNEVRGQLVIDADDIVKRAAKFETEAAAIAEAVEALRTQLPVTHALEMLAAPRFWQPRDPVLMLMGTDADPVERIGENVRASDGRLPCRREDQVATSVCLEVPFNDPFYGMSNEVIYHTLDSGVCPEYLMSKELHNAITAVSQEMSLVSFSGEASVPLNIKDSKIGYISVDYSSIVKAFWEGRDGGVAIASLPQIGGSARLGRAAQRPLMLWSAKSSPPWLPFMLDYEVSFKPACEGEFAANLLTRNAIWTCDGDIQFKTEFEPEIAEAMTYRGSTLLSGHGPKEFMKALETVQARRGGVDLANALKAVTNLRQSTQDLAGLGQAMLMGEPVMQMMVADPFASAPRQSEIDQIALAVGNESLSSPAPRNHFSAVRAGKIQLTRFRVLDAFGRTRLYPEPDICYAQRLKTSGFGADNSIGTMRPRILQPARLQARWLRADKPSEEASGHSSASPILGWLMLNRLDRGLTIYNPDGLQVGDLSLFDGDRGPEIAWRSAPFRFADPGNAVLAGLTDMLTGDAERLDKFLGTLRRALEAIQPAVAMDDELLAPLVGRPLALVQAGVSLELRGGPPQSQSWTAFERRLDGAREPADGGLSRVAIPVKLGSEARLSDGLAIYWLHYGDQPSFKSFLTPTEANVSGSLGGGDFLKITVGQAAPAIVTMLVDPRAEVHFRAGVVPTKSLRLDAEHYVSALANLDLSFRISPILAPAGDPNSQFAMVAPQRTEGDWTWHEPALAGRTVVEIVEQPISLDGAGQEVREGWLRMHKPNA